MASSGLLGARGSDGQILTGVALTNRIFESALGPTGRMIITFGIVMFAFATLIGWEYYGEKALEYLVPAQWTKKASGRFVAVYRLIYCGCALLGAWASLEAVWNFSDIMNGAMAVPNLICILLLSKEAAKMILEYET